MTEPTRIPSFSSVSRYADCPRQYWLVYHMLFPDNRWEFERNRGTALHLGLETWLKTDDLDQAWEAVFWMEGNIPLSVRYLAINMLLFYVPLFPKIEEAVLVEHEFTEFFQSKDIQVRGKVDAILRIGGLNYLVDWKGRGNQTRFPSSETVQMDYQLPVYASILRKQGYQIDRAVQVQLSAALPATPRIYAGKKGNTASEWITKIGATTQAKLEKAFEGLDPILRSDLLSKYQGKVVDPSEFMSWVEIDITPHNTARYLKHFMSIINRMDSDKEFLPLLSTHRCKECPVKQACYESL